LPFEKAGGFAQMVNRDDLQAEIDESRHDPVAGFFGGGIGQPNKDNIILYSPYCGRADVCDYVTMPYVLRGRWFGFFRPQKVPKSVG
jgi:hypothetical protein